MFGFRPRPLAFHDIPDDHKTSLESADPFMEVPSGPGASNNDRHFIVIAPVSDDKTNMVVRASEEVAKAVMDRSKPV